MSKLLRCVPVLLLMPLFIAGCSRSKSDQNQHDWQMENLKGAVKSYTQSMYSATEKFGEIEKGERYRFNRAYFGFYFRESYVHRYSFKNIAATYNEKGDLIEISSYDSDGDLKGKNKFLYDDKGNLVEEDFYESDASLDWKIMYTYDEKGNEIERNCYKSDGSLDWKIMSTYDEKGNKIECNCYKSDGSLDWKIMYTYDEKGNEIKRNSYKSDGSLDWKITRAYDKKGNEIECNCYKSDGSPDRKITRAYDKKGNEIERNYYESDASLLWKEKYAYGKNGKLIEMSHIDQRFPDKMWKRYDDKGNLIEWSRPNNLIVEWSDPDWNSNSEEGKCTYQYDKKGNWTQMVIFINGRPENIVEREYTYY